MAFYPGFNVTEFSNIKKLSRTIGLRDNKDFNSPEFGGIELGVHNRHFKGVEFDSFMPGKYLRLIGLNMANSPQLKFMANGKK
jgi:hypothetical protein